MVQPTHIKDQAKTNTIKSQTVDQCQHVAWTRPRGLYSCSMAVSPDKMLVLMLLGIAGLLVQPSLAKPRYRRGILDDLLGDLMKEDFAAEEKDLEADIEKIGEEMQRLQSSMKDKMRKTEEQYHLEDKPDNFEKTYGKVEHKGGKDIVTNTTVEKHREGNMETEVIKEVKTANGKGSHGLGSRVIIETVLHNKQPESHQQDDNASRNASGQKTVRTAAGK